MHLKRVLPAEWHPQGAVMLTWPHGDTDWAYMLGEVEACFVRIAQAILARQTLVVVCPDGPHVVSLLGAHDNLRVYELSSNDTWARDHGAITVLEQDKPVLLDFKFNGWGLKFSANYDNLITKRLFDNGAFANGVAYENCLNVALEGGSIESDGKGTILTTAECLLSPNRNGEWGKGEVERYLADKFGAKRVLWLHHGYLAGDDTDSHVDTLARLCDEQTIAYVKCTDKSDEHYEALAQMEKELRMFSQADGQPYRLVALPMATAAFDPVDGHRLPATYANFLIMNHAVLFPVYQCDTDREAIGAIREAFPNHEIVPVDCRALIRQHGSLHCVTMQFPEGVVV
ncbi:MAG: agmatine deiminase family protein [Breznakibacter sp.]